MGEKVIFNFYLITIIFFLFKIQIYDEYTKAINTTNVYEAKMWFAKTNAKVPW